MLDRQNKLRGRCVECDCSEYELPLSGHICDYCGHRPTAHELGSQNVHLGSMTRCDSFCTEGTSGAGALSTDGEGNSLRLLVPGSARGTGGESSTPSPLAPPRVGSCSSGMAALGECDSASNSNLAAGASRARSNPCRLIRPIAPDGDRPSAESASIQAPQARRPEGASPNPFGFTAAVNRNYRSASPSARCSTPMGDNERAGANMPKHITLIRHGESEANVNWSILEREPDHQIHITERGRLQAREAGRALKARIGNQPVAFFVSPYRRTVETFECIAEAFDPSLLCVRFEPRIREQDWGNFQERDVIAKAKRDRSKFGSFYYRFPNGESGADVYDRVSTLLETLYRDFRNPAFPRELIIVTHGLTLRLFLMRWFHMSVEEFEASENPENCEFYTMALQSTGRYRLERPLRMKREAQFECDDGGDEEASPRGYAQREEQRAALEEQRAALQEPT
eukprot:tig00021531_g22166.t1